MGEARKLLRQARDRLSESSYRVGLTYFRMKWYTGAINRFREVLKLDPEYTGRDAVYYYLAESLRLDNKKAEALPYYERLLQEFEQSEHIENTKRRIAELKTPSSD
jgi:outer membrane protein assembly factor BamD (BamD/ComL family)